HHDVLVGLGVLQLVIGVDGVGLHRAIEAALGRVGVVVGDGGAQVVYVQTHGRQLLQVRLDPDGRLVAAGNADQANTVKLGNLLGDAGIGQLLHRGERQAGGADGQGDHRRIGGIDLGI